MTVLVNDPQVTFIHIPKNAGVAISQWLINHVNGSYFLKQQHGGKHANQTRIKRFADKKDIKLGYTFCCVRNPWDRVVSAYHYYLKQYDVTDGRLGFSADDVTWEQFINREWRDQSWGCVNKQQISYYTNVDTILKFENLVKDFYKIQKKFDVYKPLFQANQSYHQDYKHYYTNPRWIDEVALHYKDDILQFNYSFE